MSFYLSVPDQSTQSCLSFTQGIKEFLLSITAGLPGELLLEFANQPFRSHKLLFLGPLFPEFLVVHITEVSVEVLCPLSVVVTPSVGVIPCGRIRTVFSTTVFFPRIRIVGWGPGAKARHGSRRCHFHDFFVYNLEAEHFT